jgi:hypothetical protein
MIPDAKENVEIMAKPIFPDISYRRTISRVELETYVRILRNGEYYTLHFKETVSFQPGEIVDPYYVANAYQRLIQSVYISMHFYEFPDWQTPDVNQMPEEERLKMTYPFFAIKNKPQTP